MRLTSLAHDLAAGHLRAGSVGVDATAGNGHDTLFLARAVGATGRVFAFDVQSAAIASTRRRLATEAPQLLDRVTLHTASHASMRQHLPQAVVGRTDVVMFNLGYLPGGDKSQTTCALSTCAAVEQAVELLAPDGIITLLAYPGHCQGRIELTALTELFARSADRANWSMRGAAPGDGPRLYVGARAG